MIIPARDRGRLLCLINDWPETAPSQGRPCRPWNMDFLRKLYLFGDAEQRARAEKAIDDIWAGRNGWCPVR
jgi:hypothetical protein